MITTLRRPSRPSALRSPVCRHEEHLARDDQTAAATAGRPYAGTRSATSAWAAAACTGARSASSVSSCFSACTSSWRTLARKPELAPDRLERLPLALKAEATLDDQPLSFGQPFAPTLHRLPEKRPLRLLDGVTGSRIGKEVGELGIAVRPDRLVERDRGLGAAKRLADVSELQAGRLGELLQARLAAEGGRDVRAAQASFCRRSMTWNGRRIVFARFATVRSTA